MMFKKFLLAFLLLAQQVSGQLHLQFQWGKEIISLNKSYPLGNDSISFDELKMYLSDFQFIKSNRKQIVLGAHLVDAADEKSLLLFPDFPIDGYDSLTFQFGLDSSYHVSASVEGDLDPLKGMYWAWNSGYIQFKCVGNASILPMDDQSFEFHLGGYHQPNKTIVPISLVIQGDRLILDLQAFFEQTEPLKTTQRIMIPGALAKSYCQIIARQFFTK